MIYTDCEDETILRQLIEACEDSASRGIITDSAVVGRVAGENMDKFNLFYYTRDDYRFRIVMKEQSK